MLLILFLLQFADPGVTPTNTHNQLLTLNEKSKGERLMRTLLELMEGVLTTISLIELLREWSRRTEETVIGETGAKRPTRKIRIGKGLSRILMRGRGWRVTVRKKSKAS